MPMKVCPVCEEVAMIGYGKKTCSSECGREWVAMDKATQREKVARTNPEIAAQRLRDDIEFQRYNKAHEHDKNEEKPERVPDLPEGGMLSEILGTKGDNKD